MLLEWMQIRQKHHRRRCILLPPVWSSSCHLQILWNCWHGGWYYQSEVLGVYPTSLATPYVTELLLDTMGLRGLFFFFIIGSPYIFCELAPVRIHLSVGGIFYSRFCLDSPIRMFITLFLCLLVGSMFRGLYLMVSCSSSFIFSDVFTSVHNY